MRSKPRTVSGWDIGGAHLKAALTNSQGRIIACAQLPCPLWQGLEKLAQALRTMLARPGYTGSLAAITMTGELADLFSHRDEGVLHILKCVSQHFKATPVYVFAGTQGLIPLAQAPRYTQAIASANYLAAGQLAARYWNEGLLLDIGSTTSDLIPCKGGVLCLRGENDQTRLTQGELVYSGVTRTPLMALAPWAPLDGNRVRLMAEYFATTADVYRLLGYLPADVDREPTADHRDQRLEDCARRLARMVGADSQCAPIQAWQRLASFFAERQCRQLMEAAFQVLSSADLSPEAPVIGAGIGRFLAMECARRLQRPYVEFSQALAAAPRANGCADHAPAAALARLAWEQLVAKEREGLF